MLDFKQFTNLNEKSLSDSDIEELISKSLNSVEKVINDTKRDEDERKKGRKVLSWIKDVTDTWKNEKSLHPNTVNSLMRIVTGVSSGRFGYMVPGGDKSVPQDYRR
jgi:hypothetical protein